MSIGDRLRKARIDAGFKTAKAAAAYVRLPYPTYAGHENGSRGIKTSELHLYSEVFGVSESWLLFGSLPHRRFVPLLGIFEDMSFSKAGKGASPIELDIPFECPPDTSAVLCNDASFEPVYSKGDILIVSDAPIGIGSEFRAVASLAGYGVVVGRLLKFSNQKKCHFQFSTGQVVLDVEFSWVKRVLGIVCHHGQRAVKGGKGVGRQVIKKAIKQNGKAREAASA